jgi:hypothetical protein
MALYIYHSEESHDLPEHYSIYETIQWGPVKYKKYQRNERR